MYVYALLRRGSLSLLLHLSRRHRHRDERVGRRRARVCRVSTCAYVRACVMYNAACERVRRSSGASRRYLLTTTTSARWGEGGRQSPPPPCPPTRRPGPWHLAWSRRSPYPTHAHAGAPRPFVNVHTLSPDPCAPTVFIRCGVTADGHGRHVHASVDMPSSTVERTCGDIAEPCVGVRPGR